MAPQHTAHLPEALNAVPHKQPIVVISLLRYRGSVDLEGRRVSGRDCYAQYVDCMLPVIRRARGRPIWRGQPSHTLLGPPQETWDEAFLVRYPDVAAFTSVLSSGAYASHEPLRAAALDDTRVFVATAPRTITRLTWTFLYVGRHARHRLRQLRQKQPSCR